MPTTPPAPTATISKIDAHQHFWRLGQFDTSWLDAPRLAPIRRDFLPDDLEPLLVDCGVDRSIFVQTQHNLDEARWVLGLAERHPRVAGVVGWVDLASNRCADQLDEMRRYPKFVGVRHITQDEPDDDFIVRPDVVRGLRTLASRGVPFDLLFYERHLKHAVQLAREVPDLKMVIDHLSKPSIALGARPAWEADLRAAAKFPQIHCKLSGMVTEADWDRWSVADLRPFVDVALNAFGPDRLMYGSDWPVCLLAGSYRRVHDAAAELIGSLSTAEQRRIWGDTAAEFYGLA